MSPAVPRFAHGSRVPGWDEAADLLKDPSPVPDPATTAVPAHLREQIEHHMSLYPDRRSAALPALAAAQREYGWCSPEALEQVACVMRLTPGYLAAVATFYDMLETEPVGRHSVYVCTNISCSLRGADELYGAFEQATAGDADFNLRSFECLGACDIAPMASVDGVYVGPLGPDDVPGLLADVRGGRPVLPDKQLRVRPAADPNANEEGDKGAAAPGERTREGDEPQRAVPGAATPDIAPERAAFGPPMEGDAAGPPAAIEQSPQEKTGDGGEGDGS